MNTNGFRRRVKNEERVFMIKKILVIVLIAGIALAIAWGTGLLKRTPIPPPPGDWDMPDGIAIVYGSVYDASTGNPLTFATVRCGGNIYYTLGSSDYLLEIDISDGLERCTIMASKSGYQNAYASVELNDILKSQHDFYLEGG